VLEAYAKSALKYLRLSLDDLTALRFKKAARWDDHCT